MIPRSKLLLALLTVPLLAAAAHAGATSVSVSGRQLLVEGQPFTIRGPAYGSTPVGQSGGYDWWENETQTYRIDFPLLKRMNTTAIRTYAIVDKPATLDSAVANGFYVIMGLDPVNSTDFCDPSQKMALRKEMRNMVRQFRDHPAILFWWFGNEECYNGGVNLSCLYQFTQTVAADGDAEDSSHPFATANGDLNNIGNAGVSADDASMPNLDIWGGNVYRGPDMNTFFTTYEPLTTKPFWFSEHGVDAWYTPTGQQDSTYQKNYFKSQWDSIAKNLSAESSAKVCIGGSAFEFLDEWWKAGNNSTHDVTIGSTHTDYADSAFNEEWFGLVEVDATGTYRNLRPGFYHLRDTFAVYGTATKLQTLVRGEPCAGETILVTAWALDAAGRIARGFNGSVTVSLTEQGTVPNTTFLSSTTLNLESGVGYVRLMDTEVENVLVDISGGGLTAAPQKTISFTDRIVYSTKVGEGCQPPWLVAVGTDTCSADFRDTAQTGEGDQALKVQYGKAGGFAVVFMEDAQYAYDASPFDTLYFMFYADSGPTTFTVRVIESVYGAGDIAETTLTVSQEDTWVRVQISRTKGFTINSGVGGNGVMDWKSIVQGFAFITPSHSGTYWLDDIRWTNNPPSATVTVSGTLDMENRANDGSVTVKLWQGTDTRTTTTDSSGRYTFSSVAAGTWNLTADTNNFLRKDTTVAVSSSNVTVNIGTMKGGDANNDNKINIFDASITKFLVGTSTAAGDHADPVGSVTAADLSVVRQNFGMVGN